MMKYANFVYNTMKDLNLLDSSKISLHNLSQTLLGHTSMTPFSDWWDTLKNSKIIIKLIMNAASNLIWAVKIILNIHLGSLLYLTEHVTLKY